MTEIGFDMNGNITNLRFNPKIHRPENPYITSNLKRVSGITKREADRQNQQNGQRMREKLQAKLKAKQQN